MSYLSPVILAQTSADTEIRKAMLLLIAGGVLTYIAQRMLWWSIEKLSLSRTWLRGGMMAMPVLLFAIGATLLGQGSMAISVVLASSVIALSIVAGVACISARGGVEASVPSLRLLAPLALAVFLAGFRGSFSGVHAIILFSLAAILLWVRLAWTESIKKMESRPPIFPLHGGLWALALAIYIAATLLSLGFAHQFQAILGTALVTTLSTLLIAPFLMLALIGLLANEAHHGGVGVAIDSLAAMVWAMLGVVVPVIIVIHFALAPWANAHPDSIAAFWTRLHVPVPTYSDRLVFPFVAWRIDSVALLLLCLMYLPLGLGKFVMGKLEGWILVAFFVIYVSIAVKTGVAYR